MIPTNIYTLIEPKSGNLALKIHPFEVENPFEETQRLNHYSLIWVQKGRGILTSEFHEYEFQENMLLSFSPYQPFSFKSTEGLTGIVVQFHPDFFCIHKHHQEVACHGVLFNNIYDTPIVLLDGKTSTNFEMVIEQLKEEIKKSALAQYELLISYLKIFLITASRLKREQQAEKEEPNLDKEEPYILQNLKNYIESHYKSKHSASDYADMLAITPKALSKLTKSHFNKTLTDLISERIIIEAKRELYLTNKTVKEIAYELGYNDEYYFSRFFKKNAEVSPQIYRETVGFDRATMST